MKQFDNRQFWLNPESLSMEQREALDLLQEEASEVIQEASKVKRAGLNFCRKGTDVPNYVHLQHEMMDFLILMEIAIETGIYIAPTSEQEAAYREFKLEKLKNWSRLGDVVQRIQERDSSKHS